MLLFVPYRNLLHSYLIHHQLFKSTTYWWFKTNWFNWFIWCNILYWETGKDTIPLKQLIKYANKYSFSLDYLLGLTNNNIEYDDLVIDLDILATNLKRLRKQYGKTKQQIADVINTRQSSYAHYENARNLMSLSFLYNLSKIYKDISIDKMLERKKK